MHSLDVSNSPENLKFKKPSSQAQEYRQPGLLSYVWGNIHQLQITNLPKLQNELVYLEHNERDVILATTATILVNLFFLSRVSSAE